MKLNIKRIRKRKTEGNKMSMKFEEYGSLPEWARTPNIISEAKAASPSVNYDKRCSHCNNIIASGESHLPVGDLMVPSRGGSFKSKQCMSIRMH